MGARYPCIKLARWMIDDNFVSRIRQRIFDSCNIDEETGCWKWKHYLGRGKYSRDLRFVIEKNGNKYRTSVSALKASLFAFRAYGDPDETFSIVKNGRHTWYAYRTCNSYDCINPDHIEGTTHIRETQWKIRNRIFHFRLNERLVSEIKEKLRRGMTQMSIAKEYGVARSTIQGIKSGKHWSHVD